MKTKTKIEKQKRKKKSYLQFVSPSLDGLILGRKRKNLSLLAQSGHISKFIFFNFTKYKSTFIIFLIFTF